MWLYRRYYTITRRYEFKVLVHVLERSDTEFFLDSKFVLSKLIAVNIIFLCLCGQGKS